MGGSKEYLSTQFKGNMLYLDNEEGNKDGSEFYLSSFQNSRSPLPLFFLRLIIFLGCIAMLLASIILSIITDEIDERYWPIYMTHWGIVTYAACAFFGCWVSIAALTQGSIDCSSGLPWFVKAYWVCFNIAVPYAFFITVFYYSFLSAIVEDFAHIDPVLDVFIHGVSSILMMSLLLNARHPSRLLHVWQPFCASLVYLLYTIIYYYAGGTDPNGNTWIYPNLDWADPGPTTGMVFASAAMLLALHIVTVLISLARDWCCRRYVRDDKSMSFN